MNQTSTKASLRIKFLLTQTIGKKAFVHFCNTCEFDESEKELIDVLAKIVEKDLEINAENIFSESKNCNLTAQYMGIVNQINEKNYDWRH